MVAQLLKGLAALVEDLSLTPAPMPGSSRHLELQPGELMPSLGLHRHAHHTVCTYKKHVRCINETALNQWVGGVWQEWRSMKTL